MDEQFTKDKLDIIFEKQKSFNEDLINNRDIRFSQQEWLQKQSLALIAELCEMLNEANFKWWKNPKPINEADLKEELVDVLHFYVSLCITAGMDANELYTLYLQKNEENFKRQQGKSEKKGYEIGTEKRKSL